MLLSLFCGAGGLDLGFEQAGFEIGLALDRRVDAVRSHNANRERDVARVQDLSKIELKVLDRLYGDEFRPTGVIGGPPCQSFSQANVNQRADDARTALPKAFADVTAALHARSPLDFVVMENVVGLMKKKHVSTLESVEKVLANAGFRTRRLLLNAKDYGTPQNRPRLILVGINSTKFKGIDPEHLRLEKRSGGTVRMAIDHLPEPTKFERGKTSAEPGLHPNHWCMFPRSPKFSQEGGVKPGVAGRSFKMLEWDAPSIAVAYGHREVNIHPSGVRRLSVYEAMLLQGFPSEFVLHGTMSSQIDQISEAVPPPLARAVAEAVQRLLYKGKQRQAA